MKIIQMFLLPMILSLLSCIRVYGGETWTFQIDFDEEDYAVVEHNGLISVESSNFADFKSYDGPALPIRQFSIAVPSYLSFESVDVNAADVRLLSTGLPVAKAVPPTDEMVGSNAHYVYYIDSITPPHIEFIGEESFQELRILHFSLSPFNVDQNNLIVDISRKVEVRVTLSESDVFDSNKSLSPMMADLIRDYVLNPGIIDTLMAEVAPLELDNEYEIMDDWIAPLDYLIITDKILEDSFNELLEWKKKKGLHCRLITTDTIYQTYPGSTNYEKIKNCIYNIFIDDAVSYVLLGGDISLVPTPMCRMECEATAVDGGIKIVRDDIPTDMYYACLFDQFDWDYNKDGILGGFDDGCALMPEIIVTRLPVRDQNTAKACIRKIIEYEKAPVIGYNNMRMLMAGVNVDKYQFGPMCETYYWADKIVQGYIKPYWSKPVDLYFDPFGQSVVDVKSLTSKLYNGYAFVSVYSHGLASSWELNDFGSFNSDMAYNMRDNAKPGTIINTIACFTNDFRSTFYDRNSTVSRGTDCLSQAFMSSATSSVVAYFGSSSNGWYDETTHQLGPSASYEASFYKALFSQPEKNKSFGRIATKAKLEHIGKAKTDIYYRWCQFALNPVGDPEMPIFIDTPKSFSNVSISKSYVGTRVYYVIDTGELGSNICLTGMLNGKETQVIFRNVQKISTQYMPLNPTICITKTDFVPYVLEGVTISQLDDDGLEAMMAPNSIVNCAFAPGSSTLCLQTQNVNVDRNVEVLVSDVMGNIKMSQRMDSSDSIELDMSEHNNGVYVITLVVDGVYVDSKRVIK